MSRVRPLAPTAVAFLLALAFGGLSAHSPRSPFPPGGGASSSEVRSSDGSWSHLACLDELDGTGACAPVSALPGALPPGPSDPPPLGTRLGASETRRPTHPVAISTLEARAPPVLSTSTHRS
jgi:hypothetical protein